MQFGVGEAEARAYVEAQGEPDKAQFAVWPQNEEPLAVFLRLKRQWRLHPFTGRPLGLDHAAIPPTLRLMGIPAKRWPWLFERLALCEDVVLAGRA